MQTSKGDASFIHNKQMNGRAQLLTVVYEVLAWITKIQIILKVQKKT